MMTSVPHGPNIPDDGVPLANLPHRLLFANLAKGQRLRYEDQTHAEFKDRASPASFRSDHNVELLTLQPKVRLRPIVFFVACVLVLACASYFKAEPYRAFYGALAGLLAFAMIVQYRRERLLVGNRLSAIGAVTEYRVRGKGVPHFGKGVPTIKYEFVAFDQKTYQGETGWGAAGLQKGRR
jgi:hypothetical protein